MAGKNEQKFVLKADDQTSKSLNSVSRRFKKLGKTVQGVGKGMSTYLTAPLAGAAAGLSLLGKQGLDAADRIHKLGLKTQASAEFLSEMRGITELSGIQFESFANSLTKMEKNIGDAAMGSKGLTEAFGSLGLSVADLQAMTPEEQFKAVLQGLNGVQDQTERTALAMKLMGKSGAELSQIGDAINLLGSEQTKSFRLTQKQVEAAASFNDSMTILKGTIAGFATRLAADLAPALQGVVEKVTGAVTWFTELDKSTQKTIGIVTGVLAAVGPLTAGIGALIAFLPSLATGFKMVTTAISGMNPWVLGITVAVTALSAAWAIWGDEIKEGVGKSIVWIKNLWKDTQVTFLSGISTVISNWKKLTDSLWDFFSPVIELITTAYTKAIQLMLSGVSTFLDTTASMLGKLPDKLVPDGWITGLEEASASVKGFGDSLDLTQMAENTKKNLDGVTQAVLESLETQRAAIAAQPDAVYQPPTKAKKDSDSSGGEGLIPPNATIQAPKTLISPDEELQLFDVEGENDLTRGLEGYNAHLEAFKNDAEGMFDGLGKTITDTFVDSLLAGESFADSLSQIFKDLGTNLLKSGLGLLFSSIMPAGGLLGGLFGGVLGGRAGGGDIQAGQSYWVGEQGRELFTPRTSGTVTPEKQLGSTNTQTNHIHINLNGLEPSNPQDRQRLADTLIGALENSNRCFVR